MNTKATIVFGRRFLAIFLCLTMVLQVFGATAFATEATPELEENPVPTEVLLSGEVEESENASTELNPANVVCEMEAMRNETSKHFRMRDGHFAAIQYSTAVHYENEEGQWVDIDNTLQSVSTYSGDEMYMVSNGEDMKAFASDLSQGNLFSVYSGAYGLQMQLFDGNTNDPEAVEAVQVLMGEESLDAEEPFNRSSVACVSGQGTSQTYALQEPSFIPEGLSSTVLYEDVFEGVDLQYDLFGYNVKESIIVKALRDNYSFDFVLQTDGLTPVLQDNGAIYLCNDENELIYEIPAPYMVDAEGSYSEAVYYTLAEADEGAVILTVTADPSWIEEATLPVTIDPTVWKNIDSVSDTTTVFQAGTIASGYPNMCYDGEQSLYVGYSGYNNAEEHQVVAHIDAMPTIPSNCIITSAELCVYYHEFSNDSSYTYSVIQAHEFELDKSASQSYTDWIDNMTWNIAHSGGSSTANVGELVDFVKVTAANDNSYIKLNLTKSMRKSRSFNLIFKSDSDSTKRIDNVLFEYSNGNYIAIEYQNDVGVESRYTYQTQNAGRAGTAYLSDRTQRLTLLNTLISSDSDILPFSLSLAYNSALHGQYFGQGGTQGSNMYARDYSNMKVGTGWKLSAQRCVQSVQIDGDDSNIIYWVYTDADGTEHYFCEKDGIYQDEEGLKLKMELVSETNHTNFLMTDKIGNQSYFRDGLLTYDKDVHGNGIYYVYNNASFTAASVESATNWMPTNTVSNRLTAIYRVIKGGTAERLALLTYDAGGFLTKITDEAGRETNLTTYVTGGITFLSEITYPDSVKANYYYDLTGMVGTRDMESNLGIRYEYEADHSVSKYSSVHYISETNYTTNRIVSCWNGDGNRSSYRDWGKDLVKATDDDLPEETDDIRLELIFDNNGRTICQYTTDAEITKVLGTTTLAYTVNEGTSKANNKILSAASSGLTAVNLLKDGSMEIDGVWSTNESGGSGSVERKDTTTGIAPRHGQYTMGLTVPTGAATGSFALTAHSGIPFEAGIPYTLSAYVKVPSTGFTWNSGGVLKVVLLDSNVDPITVLEASPTADIENGWQRVQATFTVGTSGTYRPGFQLEGVSGTVYIDDVQLEQSEAASVYNLVQNGSFEFDSTHWTWGTQNTLISFDPTYFGNTMLRGTSPYNGVSRAQQIIPMNCSGDTTFQLSGWAKGESAPNPSGDFGDKKRFFGLALRIDYTDDTMEFHSVPFEWSNQDWQCAAGNIVPKEKDKTIREIRVFCAHDNNYGYAQDRGRFV